MQNVSLAPRLGARERFLNAPLAPWCLAAVVLFALGEALLNPGRLGASFFDSDDATRLVQVRGLLDGSPWFDTTLPRIGAPDALLSHWSRLIDLPIAVLILVFGLVLSPPSAELAARAVWPLLLLLPLLFVLARAAERRAGRAGALIALLLAILCFSGTTQFVPGRIDHHNALILCAVAGVLLLGSSLEEPKAGWVAGAILGLGTSLGYEALALTVASLAVAGSMAAVTGRGRAGVERAAAAFALVLAAAFVLTIPPSRWLDVRCDALSANLVLLALCAAGGLAAHLRYARGFSAPLRLALLGALGAGCLMLYGAAEPACLMGPFGQVDPALWPIWLDHVSETNGILWLARTLPAPAAAFVIFVGAGLAAALLMLKKDRDDGARYFAAVLALAVVLSLWQVKLMPYAAFLAVPPLAIAIARLEGNADVSATTGRIAALATLNQTALLAIMAMLIGTNGEASVRFAKDIAAKRRCLAAESITPLAALPKGLVVTEVDLGPFIAAQTPLSVLSAPYHRLDHAILETHAILYASPDEARRRLQALGATYVVVCPGLSTTKGQGTPPADALRQTLLAGNPPAFLEPVPLAGTPIKAWRINPRP